MSDADNPIRCETCPKWKSYDSGNGHCVCKDSSANYTRADFGCIHHPKFTEMLEAWRKMQPSVEFVGTPLKAGECLAAVGDCIVDRVGEALKGDMP